MKTSSGVLRHEANAPLTHIFLSLDLLEMNSYNEENKTYLSIIRQNAERLQHLIRNIENHQLDKEEPGRIE